MIYFAKGLVDGSGTLKSNNKVRMLIVPTTGNVHRWIFNIIAAGHSFACMSSPVA